VWGQGFSESVTRKSFLGSDSGVCVLVVYFLRTPSRAPYRNPSACGRGFSEAVTRKSFSGPDSGNSNILLLLFSCTNKLYGRDMQDR
jgi:hypothetical protein